jgi:hypothetical protein
LEIASFNKADAVWLGYEPEERTQYCVRRPNDYDTAAFQPVSARQDDAVTNGSATRVFILTKGYTLANIQAEVSSEVENICDFQQIKK